MRAETAASGAPPGAEPAQEPAPPLARVRPSTLRRLEKLQALAAELSLRPLEVAAAARCLAVSLSSARGYLAELRHAGVVSAPRSPFDATADSGGGTVYHLHDDLATVRQAMAVLAATHACGRLMTKGGRQPGMRQSGRLIHIMADDVKFSVSIGTRPARRDPLVAALFGSAK